MKMILGVLIVFLSLKVSSQCGHKFDIGTDKEIEYGSDSILIGDEIRECKIYLKGLQIDTKWKIVDSKNDTIYDSKSFPRFGEFYDSLCLKSGKYSVYFEPNGGCGALEMFLNIYDSQNTVLKEIKSYCNFGNKGNFETIKQNKINGVITWSDSLGNIITNNKSFKVRPLSTSIYYLEILYNDSCVLYDSIKVTVKKPNTVIGTLNKKNNTTFIYPNPASENFLVLNMNSFSSIITIFDMQGKQVLNTRIFSSQVDISKLLKGIYTVRLIDDGNIMINKLVKQ